MQWLTAICRRVLDNENYKSRRHHGREPSDIVRVFSEPPRLSPEIATPLLAGDVFIFEPMR